MASVSQLSYLGFGVSNVGEWERFATEVLGMQISERRDDGSLMLRIDDRHYRFAIHPGGNDDLAYIGWEVSDRATLQAVAAQVRAAGAEVSAGSTEEARARKVIELVKFRDPNGVASEIVYGPLVDPDRFVSPRQISGFVTGEMGLGHFILVVNDPEESQNFYMNALGFRISDFITMEMGGHAMRLTFLHCNPRHHTIALLPNPKTHKRINHFMLEAKSVDDVGLTYELCQQRKIPVVASLGRHTNDKMLSFYMGNPSGFAVEFGCGGRQVDDSTWKVEQHTSGSLWGHRGLPGTSRLD